MPQMAMKANLRLYTQYFDPAPPEDACDATEGVRNNQMNMWSWTLSKFDNYTVCKTTLKILYFKNKRNADKMVSVTDWIKERRTYDTSF